MLKRKEDMTSLVMPEGLQALMVVADMVAK